MKVLRKTACLLCGLYQTSVQRGGHWEMSVWCATSYTELSRSKLYDELLKHVFNASGYSDIKMFNYECLFYNFAFIYVQHIVGPHMQYSCALSAFILLFCVPECRHEHISSWEMGELPIWRLWKLNLLRVSSSCLEYSASVSFNQWKLGRDKAACLSCLSTALDWTGII